MEPGWDGDVELHEGGYWSVVLCAGVGGSGGVSVDVNGAEGVYSGGGAVGNGCGDNGRDLGGSWLGGGGI